MDNNLDKIIKEVKVQIVKVKQEEARREQIEKENREQKLAQKAHKEYLRGQKE